MVIELLEDLWFQIDLALGARLILKLRGGFQLKLHSTQFITIIDHMKFGIIIIDLAKKIGFNDSAMLHQVSRHFLIYCSS